MERKLPNRIDITGKSINDPKKIWKHIFSSVLEILINNWQDDNISWNIDKAHYS